MVDLHWVFARPGLIFEIHAPRNGFRACGKPTRFTVEMTTYSSQPDLLSVRKSASQHSRRPKGQAGPWRVRSGSGSLLAVPGCLNPRLEPGRTLSAMPQEINHTLCQVLKHLSGV